MITWNRERKRTRDRLLEYDFSIVSPHPHTAGLSMIYPWENTSLSQLKAQILQIAKDCGYTGTDAEFWERFAGSGGGVVTGIIGTFPRPGKENQLYLDVETDILYYFKEADENADIAALIDAGAEISYGDNNEVYIYLPVRALPIEPLLLNCGSSTLMID